MEDLFRRIEFRQFSFETDPEFIVDMYRCKDVLEGGWFDNEEFCRMHHKIICRAKGSSWVGVLAKAVIGYADLLELSPGQGFIQNWAIHPNFRHPVVTNCLINGLREQGKKRGWNKLVFYSDKRESLEDIESIGIKRDRPYYKIKTVLQDPTGVVEETLNSSDLQSILSKPLLPFLGPPVSPDFFLSRAFLAGEYAVLNYRKPMIYSLTSQEIEYLGCHDGNEWAVFRTAKSPLDAENISSILSALERIFPGEISLSKGALEKTQIPIPELQDAWDLFLG